jgi:hypothetical protein
VAEHRGSAAGARSGALAVAKGALAGAARTGAAGALALGLALLALASASPAAAQEPDSVPEVHLDSLPEPLADSLPGAGADRVSLGEGLSDAARVEIERQLARDPLVVHGDAHVPRDSALPGSLLVAGGTLTFEGRAPGTVMVVGGDFFLRPGAEVGGDVVVIGGGFYGSGLASVAGARRVIRGERVAVLREPDRVEISAERESAPFPVALLGFYGFLPEMYNRVDGLALRWGVQYASPRKRFSALRLSAQALLRTSRDDVGWEAVAEREFPGRRLALRGAWYDLTDTGERWHRGDVEASLATFFLGEDNRFYFDRRGVELRATQEVHGPFSIATAFRNDTYRNLPAQDPFTIAADDFLPNLPVPPGTMRSVLLEAIWDGREDLESTTRGWWGRLEGEAAGGFLEGDYSFTSGRLDLRRYQPLGRHRLDARLVLGGRIGGTLPQQKRYHLGGAATLPGYEALQVRGDRGAFVNLRYRIPLPALQRFSLFRDGAWVTLLGDGGDAWESREGDPDWLGSAGVGLAGRGALREVGVYLVVPSEHVSPDQPDVSVFLHLGSFF